MREILILSFALLFAPNLAGPATAQNLKIRKHTNSQADIVETPYVTRSEFRNIRLGGSDREIRLDQIMTVASISEATALLGQPDSTKITEIGAGAYRKSVRLVYEGMEITFMEAAGRIRLEKFHIDSDAHYLWIGGKEIRPGLPSSQLSSALRKNQNKDAGSPVRSHTVRILEETAANKSRDSSKIADHEAISIKVDKSTNKVIKVRYYTLI